jgi:hypothetical protein
MDQPIAYEAKDRHLEGACSLLILGDQDIVSPATFIWGGGSPQQQVLFQSTKEPGVTSFSMKFHTVPISE